MLRFILLSLALTQAYPQVEVIKLSSLYKKDKYTEGRLSHGGVAITPTKVYLAGRGQVVIQERNGKDNSAVIDLKLKYSRYLSFGSIQVEGDILTLSYLGVDGMRYLCRANQGGSIIAGPVSRHGSTDRIMKTNRSHTVVSGLYRPMYATYLDRYDDESGVGPTAESIRKFKELYETTNAFFLSFYNDSLVLVDSAAILPLKGEAASAFKDLYLSTPLDVDKEGNMLFINHLDGYTIEMVKSKSGELEKIPIWNEEFRPLPLEMSQNQAEELKSTDQSYSTVYALYSDSTHTLVSFYQNSSERGPMKGPYYIDIISKAGEIKKSLISSYPVITKDQNDKIFFSVVRARGWLKGNDHYLVGLTIDEIIGGRAEKEIIDRAIEQFK